MKMPSNDSCLAKSLIVIDSRVKDYSLLLDSVVEDISVLILEPDQDGVQHITKVLHRLGNIAYVHLVAYGTPGCLYLGNTQLSLETLPRYQSYLLSWFLFTEQEQDPPAPSLNFYGSNVAVGDAGTEFLHKLHCLTNATVNASTTLLGTGDPEDCWELDAIAPASRKVAISG